jgi:hypothetical protein
MATWTFLTNHARVPLCIARDPGVRLRDIAASVGMRCLAAGSAKLRWQSSHLHRCC